MFGKSLICTIVTGFLLGLAPTLSAQEDFACPMLVQSALEIVGEACAGLGRNQACYGHGNITALSFERTPIADFTVSGDIMSVTKIHSLTTTPMDVAENVWGIAVLALQANLPDTLPGQNVTFILYGDTQLTGEPSSGADVRAPMQAFSLTTGIGEPACKEAPRDGLLIQAPAETTVHFQVNGIDVAVGSTALLQIKEETLGINTFEGSISVTSGGETQIAEPGQRVDAVPGQAPLEPVAYDIDDVSGAPVDLLPEPVDIPPPDGSRQNILGCEFNGGRATHLAGQPLPMNLGWVDISLEWIDAYAEIASHTLVFDGVPVDLWGTTDAIRDDGSYARRWWWVIPDPEPGEHQVIASFILSETFTDGMDNTMEAGTYSYTCTITIE